MSTKWSTAQTQVREGTPVLWSSGPLVLWSSGPQALRSSVHLSFFSLTSDLLTLSLSFWGWRAGGEQRKVEVSKEEAKLLIEDYAPTKEYSFWISAVNGEQESKALQAKHEGETQFF